MARALDDGGCITLYGGPNDESYNDGYPGEAEDRANRIADLEDRCEGLYDPMEFER